MNEKLISVNNLSVEVDNKHILKNISFDLYSGEVLCILGKSGSGKTTTALSLMNMLPENVKKIEGEILYNNQPFNNNLLGSFISAIMQNPASAMDGVFTIKSQFKDILASNNKKYSEEKVCEILEKVNLVNPKNILKSYAFQLSGGMLQRVMIAIALALESKVIIADEPTSDLDIIGQKDILDLIINLKQENKAVLMITHSLSVAEKCADRVAVMNNGEIVDIFNISELYADNRDKYSLSLLQANNLLYSNNWNVNLGEKNVEM